MNRSVEGIRIVILRDDDILLQNPDKRARVARLFLSILPTVVPSSQKRPSMRNSAKFGVRLRQGDHREERLQRVDEFRQRLRLRDLLRPFDEVAGVLYIVKDAESRVMAISPESVKRMGLEREEEVLGKAPEEYLPPELAEKFRAERRVVERRDVGARMRLFAAEDDIDLIVVGAFVHSRFRQALLGGVTRSLLDDCQVPLFMAH